jgi:hypothetical protein
MSEAPRYDPSRGWMSAEDLAVEALDGVYAMNRRVREQLIGVITDMRLAVDDGERGVMRDALINASGALASLVHSEGTDVPRVVIKWAGKA